mgnify:CR=1 FL=1
MEMNRQDLLFTTYDIGNVKNGTITHLPTGKVISWTTGQGRWSEHRQKEIALEELEKLVADELNRQTSQRFISSTKESETNLP